MATFWTGSALAADYEQGNLHALRGKLRARAVSDDAVLAARLEALGNLNRAIRAAVLAQLDEQESALVIEGDDVVMHVDCMDCFPRLATMSGAAVQSAAGH